MHGARRLVMANSIPVFYPVTVDYTKSFDQMVAENNYDFFHDITPQMFPIKGSGVHKVELQLIHFGHAAYIDDVMQYMMSHNLRFGTLPELMSFGKQNRQLLDDFPTIALGSISIQKDDGILLAPVLEGKCNSYGMRIYWGYRDSGWGDVYRFLATTAD